MKYIIFILALFCAFGLTAQDAVLSDTSYIENRSGVFWQITATTYESGRITSDQVPLGRDTATVVNAVIGALFPALTQYADAAVSATKLQIQRKRIAEAGQSLTLLIGKNYYTALSDLLGDEFIADYTMRVAGGSNINASVLRLSGGGMRYRQGSTNFTLDVVTRNWIRIRRYDGTATVTPDVNVVVDLFFDAPAKRWIDASGRYILRKVDTTIQTQNK
jgi:hypothetical protein